MELARQPDDGVLAGRLTRNRFVELTATNPAKAYGLHPRKGSIAIGGDADLMIWDEGDFTLRNDALHHNVDYTPYAGKRLRAWPGVTISRGAVLWQDGLFQAPLSHGKFLRCGAPSLLPERPAGKS